MIIYADILFLINALINYVVLVCTALIFKFQFKRYRFLLSSLLAGAYSLSILVVLNIFLSFFLKILVCLLIVFIAFGKCDFKRFFSYSVIFFLLNFLTAGIVLALSFYDSRDFYSNIYVSYINVTPLILIISLAVSYILINILSRFILKRVQRNKIYKVVIEEAGREYKLFGFCDSGNNLTEPFSGLPVNVIKSGVIKDFKKLNNKRIIPFSSAGGEGIMYAIKLKMTIFENKKLIISTDTYVCESRDAFKDMEYDIILNPNTFD